MVDFVQKAEFLRNELEAFRQVLRCDDDRPAVDEAIARLQKAVGKVEALAEDPGQQWKSLPDDQRWGYLTLVSRVGIATRELRKFGHRLLLV